VNERQTFTSSATGSVGILSYET